MLGTVFIHAIANLRSTFAHQAVLKLAYHPLLGLESTTTEMDKIFHEPVKSGTKGGVREEMEYALYLR